MALLALLRWVWHDTIDLWRFDRRMAREERAFRLRLVPLPVPPKGED